MFCLLGETGNSYFSFRGCLPLPLVLFYPSMLSVVLLVPVSLPVSCELQSTAKKTPPLFLPLLLWWPFWALSCTRPGGGSFCRSRVKRLVCVNKATSVWSLVGEKSLLTEWELYCLGCQAQLHSRARTNTDWILKSPCLIWQYVSHYRQNVALVCHHFTLKSALYQACNHSQN